MSNNCGKTLSEFSLSQGVNRRCKQSYCQRYPTGKYSGWREICKLMEVAKPSYSVPCRKTVMGLIDQKVYWMKQQTKFQLRNLCYLSWTNDMQTSRSGDGYLSLTTHYKTAEFDLMHTTNTLPGTHDHTNIACAL